MTNKTLTNFTEIDHDLQVKTLDWRNSSEVAPFFQIKHIPLETHLKWLESLKNPNPTSIAFLIKENEDPIGVTYFQRINYQEKECDWGIYIYRAEAKGRGIGKWAIAECINYAKNRLGMTKIYLEVISDNNAAKFAYQKAGFKEIKTFNNGSCDIVRMVKDL